MKQELEQKLIKKYPKIFKQVNWDMTKTAMCWGFEHGDGWYNIIDKMCSIIQQDIDWKRRERAKALQYNRVLDRALKGDDAGLIWYHSYRGKVSDYTLNLVKQDIEKAKYRDVPKKPHQLEAEQVKEKYGTLRFYVNAANDYQNGVIAMAEAMTVVTCETCGRLGSLRGNSWVYTACDEHTREEDKVNETSIGQ